MMLPATYFGTGTVPPTRVKLADRPLRVFEKAENGDCVPFVATVPVIIDPLLATKDTDPPAIAELVTVTTCRPAFGASVHFTLDLPSLSVVVDVCETDPPPVTVHVSG